MPTVVHLRLSQGSVQETFWSIRESFLPPEVREDPVTSWFLSIGAQKFGKEDGRGADRSSSIKDIITEELKKTLIQPTVNYYHEALLTIGQDLLVAEEGAIQTSQAMAPNNLLRSIHNAMQLGAQLDPEEYSESIGQILRSSHSAWHKEAERGQKGWKIWRDEVGALRNAIERVDIAYEYEGEFWQRNRYLGSLVTACINPSRLSEVGYPPKPSWEFGQIVGMLAGLGSAIIFSGDDVEPWRDLHDVFYQLERAQEANAKAPIVAIWLRNLTETYKEDDPFRPYYNKIPPDQEFTRLAALHNYLDYESPWLSAFKNCLVTTYPLHPAKATGKEFEDWTRWGSASADGSIKLAVISNPESFLGLGLQAIYEKEWVTDMAKSYLRHSDNPLPDDLFFRFVVHVTEGLAEFGYQLQAPSIARLRVLTGLARAGEYLIEDKW